MTLLCFAASAAPVKELNKKNEFRALFVVDGNFCTSFSLVISGNCMEYSTFVLLFYLFALFFFS